MRQVSSWPLQRFLFPFFAVACHNEPGANSKGWVSSCTECSSTRFRKQRNTHTHTYIYIYTYCISHIYYQDVHNIIIYIYNIYIYITKKDISLLCENKEVEHKAKHTRQTWCFWLWLLVCWIRCSKNRWTSRTWAGARSLLGQVTRGYNMVQLPCNSVLNHV